jgi:hypothetical protein
MSGLAGLSLKFINAITENVPYVSDITRAELRNFLQGRVTTVTKFEEFSDALSRIIPDLEGGVGGSGEATGEILGALEGGAIVSVAGGVIAFRGLEMANELGYLELGTPAEERARNRLRDQIQRDVDRGVIYGSMGSPSRDIQDLIRQAAEQERFAKSKRGEISANRDYDLIDPVRERGIRHPVIDIFEDDGGDDGGDDGKEPGVTESGDIKEPSSGFDWSVENWDGESEVEAFMEMEASEQRPLIEEAFRDAQQAVQDNRVAPSWLDTYNDIRAAMLAGETTVKTVKEFFDIWRRIKDSTPDQPLHPLPEKGDEDKPSGYRKQVFTGEPPLIEPEQKQPVEEGPPLNPDDQGPLYEKEKEKEDCGPGTGRRCAPGDEGEENEQEQNSGMFGSMFSGWGGQQEVLPYKDVGSQLREESRSTLATLRPFLPIAGTNVLDEQESYESDKLKEQNLMMGMQTPVNWPLGNINNPFWVSGKINEGMRFADPLFQMPTMLKGGTLIEGATLYGSYRKRPTNTQDVLPIPSTADKRRRLR